MQLLAIFLIHKTRSRAINWAFASFVAACCALNGCSWQPTKADYPNRPIKLVVPFSPGGSSDTFGRAIQQALRNDPEARQPFVIQNIKGAGATIGSRRVKDARPDGYTILLLHEAILTAKFAKKVEYGPEAFEPVAATGKMSMFVVVRDDSPYQDLNQLLAAAKDRPNEIVWACNFDTPSHFAGLLLQRESPGSLFRFVNTGDGSERLAALKGGHVEVTVFSILEYVDFHASGILGLAVCGSKRHPKAPDVPSTHELGYDVTAENMNFWWAPLNTPPERIAYVQSVLKRAMTSETMDEFFKEKPLENIYLEGDELREEVRRRSDVIKSVANPPKSVLPHYPSIVFGVCLALGAMTFVAHSRSARPHSKPPGPKDSNAYQIGGIGLLAAAWAYLATLSYLGLGFSIATGCFLLFAISLLKQQRPTIGTIVFSFGCAVLVNVVFSWFFEVQFA